jgi:hypothetical protein
MQHNNGNGVQIGLGWCNNGAPGVVFVIPAGTSVQMSDGEGPGIVISPATAREFAYALLLNAQQLDNGVMPAPPSQ